MQGNAGLLPFIFNFHATTACKRYVSQWTLPIIWKTLLLVSLMVS